MNKTIVTVFLITFISSGAWGDSPAGDLAGYGETEGYSITEEYGRVHYWLYDTYTFHNGGGHRLTQAFLSYAERIGWTIDYDNYRYVSPDNEVAQSIMTMMLEKNADVYMTIAARGGNSATLVIHNYAASDGHWWSELYPLFLSAKNSGPEWGELLISDSLIGLELHTGQTINENTSEGEVIARIGKTEIARTKIKNGAFKIILDEVPPELLKPWSRSLYYWDKLHISDPEIKAGYLDLITALGTIFIADEDIEKKAYWLLRESGEGYYDEYYYIYADRDVNVYGEFDGNPGYTNGLIFEYPKASVKTVWDVRLKKGWNKLKHHIFYDGQDIIQKTENAAILLDRNAYKIWTWEY